MYEIKPNKLNNGYNVVDKNGIVTCRVYEEDFPDAILAKDTAEYIMVLLNAQLIDKR